ncbi:MAG: D-glycero-beta-D-manno-heptose 1-phosphate adenylyltransferase [Bacteroidales bacterium]|nr:D-glycero-beta-D-manno-heptose 1-phosphate adenylyltransferase [Bacteroidales bacterium]
MQKLDYINRKIFRLPENKIDFDRLMAFWRFKEYKLVFTNGCFDILHKGHIDYLAKAADMGDVLIIGLNSDNSVKKIKGDSRPVIDEDARALTLAALRLTNAIVYFDEDTPYELINYIQPDILVKGGDYKAEDVVGYDVVSVKGGKVEIIDLVPGYSTSSIVERIKE